MNTAKKGLGRGLSALFGDIEKKSESNQVQTNKGSFIQVIPGALKLTIVTMTLIAPIIELIPII